MLGYQSYTQNQQYANQYYNPYYNQGFQNQPMNNVQMNQQQNQNILFGKIVDSLQVVEATDIPMDNNSYYFPKADGTEIYVKRWLPNFQTKIITYKPFIENVEESNDEEPQINLYDILDKINTMNDVINNIDRTLNGQKSTVSNRNKKEVKINE